MASPPSTPSSEKPTKDGDEEETRFECNICFETAQDAVVSMCGHLYCWPCIHRWMEARHGVPTCPVCKSAIEKEKLIPLYGRGGKQTDPRTKVPPRPQGQREEVPPNAANFSDGIQFSFGLGLGPLIGMPLLTLQTGGINRNPVQRQVHHVRNRTELERQQQGMARIMLTLAILFLVMIFLS